jgi:hypothetical protein
MSEPHVTLDPSTLNPVEQKLQGALEDQLSSALQAAVERVEAGYAGQSVEQVAEQLLEQTRYGLHEDIASGWQPDPGQLQQVAREIVARRS